MSINNPLVPAVDPIEATASAMLEPSQKTLGAFGAAMKGVSSSASAAFADFQQVLTALSNLGPEISGRVKALEADRTKPSEYVRDERRKLLEGGELMRKKLNGAAHSLIPKMESGFEESLLPRAH